MIVCISDERRLAISMQSANHKRNAQKEATRRCKREEVSGKSCWSCVCLLTELAMEVPSNCSLALSGLWLLIIFKSITS
jgi:hypothetical protein